jgi:hypothetical protein
MAAALTSSADLERIPLNSCYLISLPGAREADCLAAWLNSTWMGAVARLGAMPASGGFARFNARAVARLPLPESVRIDPELEQLAREGRSGTPVQTDLDRIAARHLGLSSRARSALRAVVERSADSRR